MNILCYGDSNTYGYDPRTGLRYPEDVRWTGLLQQMLRGEYRLIEEGCNGRTTAFTPRDEEWKDGRSYLKACLNSHKPLDLVILMLGSNDLKREFQASPEDIARGIREMLDTIRTFMPEKQGYCPDVLLIAPPRVEPGITQSAFSDRFDVDAVSRSEALASLYKEEAARFAKAGQARALFLNAAEHITASPVDSLHLDPSAHQTLAAEIHKSIQPFLK